MKESGWRKGLGDLGPVQTPQGARALRGTEGAGLRALGLTRWAARGSQACGPSSCPLGQKTRRLWSLGLVAILTMHTQCLL